MLFDSRFFRKIQQQRQTFRPLLNVVKAAPIAILVLGLVVLSADRMRAIANNLDIVSATITKDAATSTNGELKLAFTCGGKPCTATITAAQLAQGSSNQAEQIPERYKLGNSISIGVNSECEVVMLKVSKPPLLVYLLFTVFMGIVTLIWFAWVDLIWRLQGKMLDALSNQDRN